ncbi:MAG TPA: NIPSNAP family protein [Verrucomicrobiae bacterium]
MRKFLLSLASAFAVLALHSPAPITAAEVDKRCFEMRVYTANPDKMEALHARFRDHTLKMFEKHGIESIGYWVPVDNKENKLYFLIAYPSREARETLWQKFQDDPAWKKAKADSEKNGALVSKADSTFLQATDYSPVAKASKAGAERVFELRTYTATTNNLGNLNARFRDHTVKLFSKYGMTNIGYWTPMADQPGAQDTLIYFLAHKSQDAAKESFAAFGKDPEWTAARKASEEKGGGPLTIKGGVKSIFMKPTDYSPMR